MSALIEQLHKGEKKTNQRALDIDKKKLTHWNLKDI